MRLSRIALFAWMLCAFVALAAEEAPVAQGNDGTSSEGRRRMAVGDFIMKAESVSLFGSRVETAPWAEMFSNSLNIQLTQSRKFTMLDRKFTAAVRDELQRLSSANASPADASRLCQQLGTDYLVLGTIMFCDVAPLPVNPYTGQALPTASSPYLDVAYRVILAPTGQIKWADDIKIAANEIPFTTLADFFAQSAELAATRVADSITAAILPFEIVKVYDDGRVIIGEGGRSLQQGEVLNAYKLGEEVRDTRTGEVIDTLEEPLGMVLVERVTEKLSYGRILSGDPAKITVGTRLRRDPGYILENSNQTTPTAPTNVKQTPAGGIVVPF